MGEGEYDININTGTGNNNAGNKSNFYTWFLFILAGICICVIVYLGMHGRTIGTPDALYRKWEDSVKKSYEVVLKQKEDSIVFSSVLIETYKDSIKMLHSQFELNNQEKEKIKKIYDEKINRLNDMSSDDLYLFFTERYGR